jgi:hypothetical protein
MLLQSLKCLLHEIGSLIIFFKNSTSINSKIFHKMLVIKNPQKAAKYAF